jgi:hypothetical protein
MCDYSLHLVAHRPAAVGDRLVSTRFRHTTTHGFMAQGEPELAICVLPGTELAFDEDVAYRAAFFSFRPRHVPHRVARFRNINEDNPHAFHDALEFPDGQIVLLTDLLEGQSATVLQLPATERPETHTTTSDEVATDTPIDAFTR